MAKYETEQRKQLLSFLEENAHRQLSVKEISFSLGGAKVSQSAVYRNLAQLEKEGRLRRFPREGSREACYQYIGCEGCRSHIHLLCTGCGKTFHLGSEETRRLVAAVADGEAFAVNTDETVLYGLCAGCRGKALL